MAKRSEKPRVQATQLATERTPLVPRTPSDGLTLVFFLVTILLALACVLASWVLLLPGAHEKGIAADRIAEETQANVPVSSLPPVLRTKSVTSVGPEVVANPDSLGKPNPFSK
jgi:hypothetical protein